MRTGLLSNLLYLETNIENNENGEFYSSVCIRMTRCPEIKA